MSVKSLQLKLFRCEAIDASGRRWLGPVRVATPPGIGTVTVIAMLACGMLAVATIVIEVPERIRANGVLLPSGKMLKVRAERSGIVDQLFVGDGDLVSRSELLLKISGHRSTVPERSDLEQRVASLQRELALLDISEAGELSAVEEDIRVIRARLELTRQRLHAAGQEHATQRRQSEVAARRLRRIEALAEDAVVAAQYVDEQITVALKEESRTHVARQQVLALRAEVAAQERELESSTSEPELIAARSGMRREAMLRELSTLASQRTTDVTAPDGGEVVGLLVRDGSAVTAGQLLLSLIEPDSTLDAFIYIGVDNAGRVVPGQHVELQLHAFPHQVYGTIAAVVSSVSTVPLPAASLDLPIATQGSVFEIRASVDKTVISVAGERWELPVGAAFRADLIRERWPLYRWLTRALRSSA